MKKIIIITGASSGFGALTARALAGAGHTVYASMRATMGRNAPQVAEVARYAADHKVDLRTVELDVSSDASVEQGIATVIAEAGRLDVVIHNAGHMSFGPAEAFTPEQFAELYDVNVLSAQRVNRAVLPHMRKRREGLVVWVSSSSTRGGTPPYLSPYFAAKAAMDSLAVSYASELTRWGIETAIVVPGAFTKGTNHFAHAGAPRRTARRRIQRRTVQRRSRTGAERTRVAGAGRCGCRGGGGGDREDRGHAVRQAPVPDARRSIAGWRGDRQWRRRSRPRRDVPAHRPRGSARAARGQCGGRRKSLMTVHPR